MRTRKEIENEGEEATTSHSSNLVLLEVLLDIRELLEDLSNRYC